MRARESEREGRRKILNEVLSHLDPLTPALRLRISGPHACTWHIFKPTQGRKPTVGHVASSTAVHFAT